MSVAASDPREAFFVFVFVFVFVWCLVSGVWCL
jgi:hypothetical protein